MHTETEKLSLNTNDHENKSLNKKKIINQKHLFFLETQDLLILFALATISELIFQARSTLRYISCGVFIVASILLYVANEACINTNLEPVIYSVLGVYLLYIVWNGYYFYEQLEDSNNLYISATYGMITLIYLCTGIPQSILFMLTTAVIAETFIRGYLELKLSALFVDFPLLIFYIFSGLILYYSIFSIGLEICRIRYTPLKALQSISKYLEPLEEKAIRKVQLLSRVHNNAKLRTEITNFLSTYTRGHNRSTRSINSPNVERSMTFSMDSNPQTKSRYLHPNNCNLDSSFLEELKTRVSFGDNDSNRLFKIFPEYFIADDDSDSERNSRLRETYNDFAISTKIYNPLTATESTKPVSLFKKSYIVNYFKKKVLNNEKHYRQNSQIQTNEVVREIPFLNFDEDECTLLTSSDTNPRAFEKYIQQLCNNAYPDIDEIVNRIFNDRSTTRLLFKHKTIKKTSQKIKKISSSPLSDNQKNTKMKLYSEFNCILTNLSENETTRKMMKIQKKLFLYDQTLKSLNNTFVDLIRITIPRKDYYGRNFWNSIKYQYVRLECWLESIRAIMIDAQWKNPPACPQTNLWGQFLDEKVERWRIVWESKMSVNQISSLLKTNVICTLYSIALVWIILMTVTLNNSSQTFYQNSAIVPMLLYLTVRSVIHIAALGFVTSLYSLQISMDLKDQSHFIRRKFALLGIVGLILTECDHFAPIVIFQKNFAIIPIYTLSNTTFPIFTQLPLLSNTLIAVMLAVLKICFMIVMRQLGLSVNFTLIWISVAQFVWFNFITKIVTVNYRFIFCRHVLPYILFLNASQLPDDVLNKLNLFVDQQLSCN